MNRLPISVLIPTMNRPETLERTIKGYIGAQRIPKEIIIVDQSENVETAEKNKKIVEDCNQYTCVIYVYQNVPSSTAARNNAFNYAHEEIVVFSDDDVDVYPDTLSNIYATMQDTQIAMIAGIDDNAKSSKTRIGYILGTKSLWKRKIGHVTASMLGRYPEQIHGQVETEWAMGYFFAVRKSLITKWQIQWDELLTGYAYAEDLDFTYTYYKKAAEENLRCILSDQVRVRHIVSQEYRTPSRKVSFAYVYNRIYLAHKHGKSNLAVGWCNLWRIVERFCRKQSAHDLVEAVRCAKKDYQKIITGNIDYSKFL